MPKDLRKGLLFGASRALGYFFIGHSHTWQSAPIQFSKIIVDSKFKNTEVLFL